MNRTVYIAPNLAYVENHLGRKLMHPSESFARDRDHLQGLGGPNTTIHFLGFWWRGYENPTEIQWQARTRMLSGVKVINAPWVQP